MPSHHKRELNRVCRINDEGYLTDRLTDEAVAFIERHKSRPFLLYLAYNAVHAPAEAPQADIAEVRRQFPDLDKRRSVLMAMLKHLDDGVGRVVAKLKQEGLFENTVLFFLTDNGGARAMHADNTPLRGFKGSFQEGGIRTPFMVSWPARFSGGHTINAPVISIDILPTALDAVGVPTDSSRFDGRSLLPLLTGQTQQHHDTLYWSKGSDEWAVRRGDWKLRGVKSSRELFDLGEDPEEKNNVAVERPGIVQALQSAYDTWIESMADPISGDDKRRIPATARGNQRQRPRGTRPR